MLSLRLWLGDKIYGSVGISCTRISPNRMVKYTEESELEARREGWSPKPAKYTRGVLGKYAKVVQSAAHGAVCG